MDCIEFRHRKQIPALIVILVSAFLGIGSRKFGIIMPNFIAEYAGDTMWALAFFGYFRLFLPRQKLWKIILITLDFAFLIELSQLFHPSWLEIIRQNTLGGLLIGFGFRWTDLLCYTVGCLIGYLIFCCAECRICKPHNHALLGLNTIRYRR